MTYRILFLAGAAGIVLFLLIGLISFIVLRGKRKKIEAQIHSEYRHWNLTNIKLYYQVLEEENENRTI